ncbi:MAG: RNA methyltransferase [Acidimicrobiales bacterium]|nr:RNA methyltransferase [Acidimicrobiales bacterium]RZV45546.1 MAG: RNA methyltransferase [Acidimicrobiales bacterium]
MTTVELNDPGDERLAVFLGLRDQVARQHRERPGGDMHGFFIAEGDLVIERGVRAGFELRSVLMAERRSKPLPDSIGPDVLVIRGGDDVLVEVTGRAELRDPIACFVRPALPEAAALIAEGRSFAVLEGINNPNNLGVIMRNAAALGIDAVLLDPTCGDPLYRRAIRSSMGQVFVVPHARIEPLGISLPTLHDRGVSTIALTPSASTRLDQLDLDGVKTALLLGAEGPGLTQAALKSASHHARIPMTAEVDSLNVGSAAAVAFYELARTRG